MLKATSCELDLFSDPEIFRMVDRGIRGGIAVITHRRARANNPLLGPTYYNPAEPTSYIIYLDANNLYGWAMSQSLPCSTFELVTGEDVAGVDWLSVDDDAEIGYFLEVDLEYPPELHDGHNEYPLAAERLQVTRDMISAKQVYLKRVYNLPRNSRVEKLTPNLKNKTHYLCHYRLLKFYIAHGMRLTKVHRAIKFRQSKGLESYIVKNQNLRKEARTAFQKDFFKLMNNSVYGKTCENQKKRTDIRLVTDEQQVRKLIEKPHCKDFRIFNENLVGIELRKVRSHINKPFYTGFAVLELSKLHMYRFHYDYMKLKYGARAKLLFTDTDSLMYHVQTDNIYADIFADRAEFDLASYPRTSPYYDATNDKSIGKFKDEASGEPILEFIGLRPKMYSFVTVSDVDNARGAKLTEKHRAKGIQFAAQRGLRHADYERQLEQPATTSLINRRIGSKSHQLYTIETEKRALCSYDDKRYLLDDNISSLAFGHKDIPAGAVETVEEEGADLDQVLVQPQRDVANSEEEFEASESDEEAPTGSSSAAQGIHPIDLTLSDDEEAPLPDHPLLRAYALDRSAATKPKHPESATGASSTSVRH